MVCSLIFREINDTRWIWRSSILNIDDLWNKNDRVCSVHEDIMLNYKGNIAEKKERVKILMPDLDYNERIETSAVVKEAESSRVDRVSHKTETEWRNINSNIVALFQSNSFISCLRCQHALITLWENSIWRIHPSVLMQL